MLRRIKLVPVSQKLLMLRFLMTRYQSEYTIDLPGVVKKIIIPITYSIGKMLGKYEHFKDAPPATKSSDN